MQRSIIIYLLSISFLALSHEEHENKKMPTSELFQEKSKESGEEGRPTSWIQWIGSFHLIFLHFPIALINMLVISELLLIWLKRPIFNSSSRFLVVSSAILSPLTALLGLTYSYSATYEGLMGTFLLWHMWLGIFTALFAVAMVLIREKEGIGKLYYSTLLLSFWLVNLASYFGGGMSFGPYHMFPPA